VGRHRGLTTQDSSGRRRLAVLRRWLHGRVDWWPAEVGRWLRRLAEILPAVHAVPLSRGPAPVLPQVLIHRDFHPGNVLWRRGLVCGIVDWQAICSGPAAADVARCRVNLLTLGTSAAEQFTACWQHVSGAAYHPWADVVTSSGSSTTCARTGDPNSSSSRTCSAALSPNSAGAAGYPGPA
jgi:aminoglycoside phosphotransferase (APT) family kinase protein